MSNSLENDNVTGYSMFMEFSSSKTSVSLSLMTENGKTIELSSKGDVSDCQLSDIADLLGML